MSLILDTHYHLDFLDTGLHTEILAQLAEADIRIVAQTLTPSSFMELRSALLKASLSLDAIPLISLGFHPWHIPSDEQLDDEIALFAQALAYTRFIGEIGLDFSPRRLTYVEESVQRRVFRTILHEICHAAKEMPSDTPYVLSIHAVQSASAALEILADLRVQESNAVPVFHRFSGTSDELTELIRIGGYISVHPQMLSSKRGRAYVKQVPAERLLLESDLPADRLSSPSGAEMEETVHQHSHELTDCLGQTLTKISQLRGIDMKSAIATTQSMLYEMK